MNVDLPPYWETMWGTYFLSPRTVYLQKAVLLPEGPSPAVWTLEPTATPDPPGEVVQQLNPEYKLVKKASS